MGEDPEAPNYDPVHKIIRSMQNDSRGPMRLVLTMKRYANVPTVMHPWQRRH